VLDVLQLQQLVLPAMFSATSANSLISKVSLSRSSSSRLRIVGIPFTSFSMSAPRGRGHVQLLVLLQLDDVVPQQLDVLQLQQLEQLQLLDELQQLVLLARSVAVSASSLISNVSHSSSSSSSARIVEANALPPSVER
jgi:hypothetical protein